MVLADDPLTELQSETNKKYTVSDAAVLVAIRVYRAIATAERQTPNILLIP